MTSHEKDLEPQLSLQPEKLKPKARGPVLPQYIMWGSAAVCVIFLALNNDKTGGGHGVLPSMSDSSGDKVSLEQRAEIDGKFSAYTAKLVPVKLSDQKQMQDFLSSPYLQAEAKKQILAEVARRDKKVAIVSLWDNFDEDGDVVSVTAGGITLTVPISHAPTQVYIPYKDGEPLVITGLRDGGGGITAAIETSSGSVPLPIMVIGQKIILPLI
jgi:hypothetical protein